LLTGNGSFNATAGTISSTNNFSMSALKFSTTNGRQRWLIISRRFDQASQGGQDLDLGSGGARRFAGFAGSTGHPHLVVGAAKRKYLSAGSGQPGSFQCGQ